MKADSLKKPRSVPLSIFKDTCYAWGKYSTSCYFGRQLCYYTIFLKSDGHFLKRWFISWITVHKLQILLFFASCIARILKAQKPLKLANLTFQLFDSSVLQGSGLLALQRKSRKKKFGGLSRDKKIGMAPPRKKNFKRAFPREKNLERLSRGKNKFISEFSSPLDH